MNRRYGSLAWSILIAAIGLLLLAPRSSYQPGALLAAHQQLSSDCAACHRAWRGPSNDGCVTCHGDTGDSNPHSGSDVTLEDGLIAGRTLALSPSRSLECLSCHREHRGAAVDINASSTFACTWCHKHPAINEVAEHMVPVMARQFFVRHLFQRRFNHYEHELLVTSHYPPIAGGFTCTSCHLVPPLRPGGQQKMSLKWSGCAGVGCHVTPQDGFMQMPAAIGRSPVTIAHSGMIPMRHIKAIFVHSSGHLQSACEECHFKVAASRNPDDSASLAIKQCFTCHAHQPETARKSAAMKTRAVAARRRDPNTPESLPLTSGLRGGATPRHARNAARPSYASPYQGEAVAHSSAPQRGSFKENKFWLSHPPPSRRPLPDRRRAVLFLEFDRPGAGSAGELSIFATAQTDQINHSSKFRARALADTPVGRATLTAIEGRTVLACGECHLFHANGVVPTLDFPQHAPAFPPNQPRRFQLTLFLPHARRGLGDAQLGPLPMRSVTFSPWWMGLVAIGFVAYRFALHSRKLARKQAPQEVVAGVAPQRAKEVPALDDTYQTNIRHLHIVGEAAGTASINLAMRSGRQVIEAIAGELRSAAPPVRPHLYDVVIVGCGPAGLGATATARVSGLKYATLEKLTPASTLRSYPRAKFVQATPIDIEEYGSFFLEGDNSREELIKEWEKIIARLGLVINDREEVVDIVRQQEGFVVKTARGNSYPARCVVLAIGLRGNPRHLNLPGEIAGRVVYSLIEPDEFTGRKILVVGGGNAGAETVQALAEARLGNTISYSFRSPALTNVTRENAEAISALQQAKKITVYPATVLTQIRQRTVMLEPVKSAPRQEPKTVVARPAELDNDLIFAMIGAELPTAFLKSIGIRMVSKGRAYG